MGRGGERDFVNVYPSLFGGGGGGCQNLMFLAKLFCESFLQRKKITKSKDWSNGQSSDMHLCRVIATEMKSKAALAISLHMVFASTSLLSFSLES